MKKLVAAVVLGGLGLSTAAANAVPLTRADFSAAATDIDFDNLTGGTDIFTGDIITNQYAGQGVSFVNPDFVTRANATPLGSSFITDSKPNVAFILQGSGNSGPNVSPQQLLFSVPVTKVGMSFFVSSGADVTLDVYGAGNTLLESATLTGTPMASGFQEGFIGLGEPGLVTMATVTSHGPGGQSFNLSIDDVLFEGPAAVPEPAGLGLLGIGLLGLGVARRRASGRGG